MKKLVITLLPLALAVGCGGDGPTELPPLGAGELVAALDGNSGCTTVRFHVSPSVTGLTTFAGPITGDLEGTAHFEFIGPTTFTGVARSNGGTSTWNVTGGVLGPLVFEAGFDNRNIDTDRPGSPATLFENTGRLRAISGVEKANLTYQGFFSLLTLTAEHDYNGVICP